MPDPGRRVYVVDDDVSVRRSISRLLRIAGYSPRAYTSGEEFLRQSKFDDDACVVCDIRMPGKSGLDVFDNLSERGIDLPFIFISAVSDEKIVDQAKKVGKAFVAKPIDGEELIAVIEFLHRN